MTLDITPLIAAPTDPADWPVWREHLHAWRTKTLAELSYDDHETKKGPDFSTKRRITITEKTKLDIKLDFKSYSFNETLSFPFSVPKNYKRN